jgi:glutathione S-transferase
MADELVFYTNPQSRGAMTHWMLEEIGCPYRVEVKQFGPDMKTPEYLAINPMGKVPAIKHGNTVITETGAILCYLADAFPQAGLAPAIGDKARGTYFRWLFFIAGPAEAASGNHASGWDPTPDQQGRFGYGTYDTTIDALEKAVDGKRYIAGDRFTAADLYVASFLFWGMQVGIVPKRPVFETYAKPHIERPAGKRADEKGKALMAQSKN